MDKSRGHDAAAEILTDQSRVLLIKSGGKEFVAFRDGQEVMYGERGKPSRISVAYTENDGSVTLDVIGRKIDDVVNDHIAVGGSVRSVDRFDYGKGKQPERRY